MGYLPCVLKSNDMMLIRDDMKGFVIPPRVASRMIMNNHTISLFMSDNFGDVVWSVNLQDVKVRDYKEKNCITLTNTRNAEAKTVCGMAFSKVSLEDQITDWKEKIQLFKNKCPGNLEAERMFPPE